MNFSICFLIRSQVIKFEIIIFCYFIGLCNILYYSNVYPLLNNFLSNLIQPIYNELGWNEKNSENENYTSTQLRPLILSMACKVGNQNCLSFAGQLFRRWKEEGTQISPDLRTVVYSYGKYHKIFTN